MNNFDQDTSDFANDNNDATDKEGDNSVKDYPVSRVVVNPAVFDLLRKNSLSDPVKRERWLITRLGQSPAQSAAPQPEAIPIYIPKN